MNAVMAGLVPAIFFAITGMRIADQLRDSYIGGTGGHGHHDGVLMPEIAGNR